ncbi:MAG: shikimate dehydrogenase [FCB group bacterium]|nr:shikimate dehydrogenase [FCB group bacterium]
MIKLAVIGYPVAHSRSPELFQEFGRQLNLDIHYEKVAVQPENLSEFMTVAKAGAYQGLNVTIPLKEKVIPDLETLEPEARDLGAVNCIYSTDRTWTGANTDWQGFMKLLETNEVNVGDFHWVVLGAGGAARSVMYALVKSGMTQVSVLNRSPSRLDAVIADFRQIAPGLSIEKLNTTGDVDRSVPVAWVNATPLGMAPLTDRSPLPADRIESHHLVVDTVYIPRLTQFILHGESRHARTLNGLSMFIYQGLFSLEHWLQASLHNQIDMEQVVVKMERSLC